MLTAFFSRSVILVFGLLYPAYNSYKAIKTKNVKEYVKWMMYWIVFSLFTAAEMVTDIFLSWFPFYYEIKILFVFWLLSPWTRGANILYIKVVHPQLSKHENEIDSYINQASDKGYSSLIQFGTKGIDCLVNGLTVGANKALEHINEVKEKSQMQGNVSTEITDEADINPLTTCDDAPANMGTASTSDGDSRGPTKKVRRQKSTDKVTRKSIKKLANGDEKQDPIK